MAIETATQFGLKWLRAKVKELKKESGRFEMAAAENFRLWQEQKDVNEGLKAEADYVRGWCIDEGYTLVVRVMDRDKL